MNEHRKQKSLGRSARVGLSVLLTCSSMLPYTMVQAEEQLDASRVYTAVDVSADFHAAPLYDAQTNTLTLPQIKGYDVEIFGSDNQATIALDGTVTRPLQEQSVKLLYKITNRETNESITTETNAVITIPAAENTVEGSNAKPEVIPELREWDGGEGTIDLTKARILVQDEAFAQAAATFAADYEEMTGRKIEIVTDAQPQAGDILFARSAQQMLGEEGYALNIGGDDADADVVEIEAIDHDGALYAGISILQILKQDEGMNELPRGLIRDYPKFAQRGMMLDVARKYIPIEYLHDLSKQMSWYKLNMLSLHLSDNDIWNGLSIENGLNGEPEGWFRLECDTYPELTSPEHYTKDEFRTFQEDALDLGIDVIPEMDTPGHALAYTRAWGMEYARYDNQKYLDVLNPEVLEMTKALFSEYINGVNGEEPTFIGEYVNIGTDEYKTNGLPLEERTAYREGFRQYCNDLLEYVNSTGKKAVFWGSLSENSGTTPVTTDALMFAWYQGYANAKASLDAGYDIISMEDLEVYIVPGGGYYSQQFGQAEYLYNSWLPNNNRGWAGDPAPDGHPGVKGGQFAVWNDFHGNGISVNDISYRIQHNLYAVAEKTWAGTQASEEGKSYADIKELAAQLGDAPNADFLYEVDQPVVDDELLKLNGNAENSAEAGAEVRAVGDSVKLHQEGKDGAPTAISLSGKNSTLTTDIQSPGFDWTFASWMKLDEHDEEKQILTQGKSGTIYVQNGQLKYDVENYTHAFDYKFPEDEWFHLALTGTYEGVTLYVNGEKIDALINKPFPNWNVNSGCDSWSGSYPTNADGVRTQRYYETLMLPMGTIGDDAHSVKGTLDQLMIFDRVLEDEEIADLAGHVFYKNLALNQPVSASGQETADFPAEKGNDGELSTRWSSNYSDDAWWQVDLGEVKAIREIVIDFESDTSRKYKVLISADGEQWQEVYDEQDGHGGTKVIELATQQTARYVKFQGVERGAASDGVKYGFSFFEFSVYGDEVQEGIADRVNVALNKEVEVGNYSSEYSVGNKAVDGDMNTRWEFALDHNETNFIEIPLMDGEDVDTIAIYQMVWNSVNRITDCRITTIKDGEETTLLEQAPYDEGTFVQTNGNQGTRTTIIHLPDLIKDVDAIRMYLTPKAAGPDDLVNIREIELYGSKRDVSSIDLNALRILLDSLKGLEESTFTQDQWERLQTLISESEAKMNEGFESQSEADAAYEQIVVAYIQLIEESDLAQWIALAESLSIDRYTVHSWNVMSEALAVAKQVASDDNASQAQIEEAAQTLSAAIDALQIRASEAAMTALQDIVRKAEAMQENSLNEAIENAKALLVDPQNASVTAVVSALLDLSEAMQAVNTGESVDALRTDVQATIDFIKENILSNVDNVRPGKVDALEAAVDAAQTLIGDPGATAEQLKAANKAMTKAAQELWEIVTKTELEALIEAAQAYEEADYTAESYAVLQDEIANAKAVAENDDAITSEVTDTITNLANAIANLEAITLDTSALAHEIELVTEMVANIGSYVPSTVEGLADKLAYAQNVLETATSQEAIDAATETLREARLNARTKADVSALEELIAMVNSLDLQTYTSASVAAMNVPYTKALVMIKNEEVTQEQVDELAAAMQTAIDELQPKVTPETGDTVNDSTDTGSANTAAVMQTGMFDGLLAVSAGLVFMMRRRRQSK